MISFELPRIKDKIMWNSRTKPESGEEVFKPHTQKNLTTEFADGRNEVSPDSEEIERIATKLPKRNFPSVEQIQGSIEKLAKPRKESKNGKTIRGRFTS